ncbi:MAG TPA: hypothetical protein PKE04_05500 [Clostridia bacterium]|nr:hypothetical protein [Clostridia bacterium]
MVQTQTGVRFQTDDALLQKLFDAAEAKLKDNLKDFGGRRVLIEGGGYHKIWLETQPMGGEMYAKRDLEAAVNNQLLFMEHQRPDGRLPGSIKAENGRIIPEFNKFQGFCFPAPALNVYYWMGRDGEYLNQLYRTLERFDAYLWRVRDSDGDGCLESWCVYDTGEDNARRYGDAPRWWEAETPPEGYGVVPMASMDFMGYSYSARDVLSKISTILGNGKSEFWRAKALCVARKIRAHLWRPERGACFDRDKNGRWVDALVHNNLRCMYWGAFSQDMADRFVAEHLLNPSEFWTSLPLPSVAANDPLFVNEPSNDWSGQPQGLTYQRAIRALENYGHHRLIPVLAQKLFGAVGEACVFPQQFDPFTARRSGDVDGYGPTMLAVLEYLSRLHGIHPEGEELWWGVAGGRESEYTQVWGDRTYALVCDGSRAEARIDGKRVFAAEAGQRVVTDSAGNIRSMISTTK